MIQKLPSSLSPYWSSRGEISHVQGLLLKGPCLIIPSSMRLEILDRIHDGHQGIVKCRRRPKDSVWWPGLGKQLEEMATKCRKCIEHWKPNSEPMIPSAVPARPWQVLGTDLFSLNGRKYLLVVDYFSRFIEICWRPRNQVKRYAHWSPYSSDREYPISWGLTMGHNSSQRNLMSSLRNTRSHMWRQAQRCRRPMAKQSEPYKP